MLPRSLPAYAELHCRSNFSFLSGASHPEELIAAAQQRGYSALAITDDCSLSGVVRAHAEGQRLGMPLIIGARMQLSMPAAGGGAGAGTGAGDKKAEAAANHAVGGAVAPSLSALPASRSSVLLGHAPPCLVVLAQSRRGYGNLSQWISIARRRAPKGQYLAHASDVEGRVPHAPFLAGLPDCFAILLPPAGQG